MTTFHDYKDRYLAALERLCEEYPERDLDDLKREAESNVLKHYQPELDPDIPPSEKARLTGYKGD